MGGGGPPPPSLETFLGLSDLGGPTINQESISPPLSLSPQSTGGGGGGGGGEKKVVRSLSLKSSFHSVHLSFFPSSPPSFSTISPPPPLV